MKIVNVKTYTCETCDSPTNPAEASVCPLCEREVCQECGQHIVWIGDTVGPMLHKDEMYSGESKRVIQSALDVTHMRTRILHAARRARGVPEVKARAKKAKAEKVAK